MKKSEATKLAGGRNKLADILGITGSAVSQWKLYVPSWHVHALMKRRPHWFRKGAQK